MNEIRFVIVTGLSGAGKSQAIRSLEDLGFFCVDNLPPTLLGKFAELFRHSGDRIQRVAVVIDVRGREFFPSFSEALTELEREGVPYQILFLEAQDEVLVHRFKETRRRHPLQPEGRIVEAIREERELMQEIRGRSQLILDTSEFSPGRLRSEVAALFGEDKDSPPLLSVVSFGFKYGLPKDADLVFDVRFLPNPRYVEDLRYRSGNDPLVREYVLKWPVTDQLVSRLLSLLDFLLPNFRAEGKSSVTVAVGCTGGRHRSVVIANVLGEHFRDLGRRVLVEHRDISREARED